MKLVFLGAPGAGKGTLAKKVSHKLNIPHISTGDIFRQAINNKTELGVRIKEIMDLGQLVPDSLTNDLIESRISEVDCAYGYILDGYPRTIDQAEFLDTLEILTKVVLIEVDEDILVKRLSGRISCPKCKEIYNIYFKPPKKEGICNVCGSALIKRKDDTEETARNRIAVYKKQTEPLIKYYKSFGKIVKINGNESEDEVFNNFLKKVVKE